MWDHSILSLVMTAFGDDNFWWWQLLVMTTFGDDNFWWWQLLKMTTFGGDNFRPIPVRHSESNQIRYSNDNAVCGIKNLESASFSHLCKSFSAPFLIRASGNLTAELNGVHSFTLISWICFPSTQGLYSWCCFKKIWRWCYIMWLMFWNAFLLQILAWNPLRDFSGVAAILWEI